MLNIPASKVLEKASGFQVDLAALLNRYSQENGSDTPDFILAKYLNDCLTTWNHSVSARESWYGRGRVRTSVENSPHTAFNCVPCGGGKCKQP
jgi:hypothetical protein